MNKNFNTSLESALKNEISWLDDFINPYADYQFSSQFKSNMKTIIPKADFTYISVGKVRIRKAALAILVALLSLAITGCAVAVHYIVEWHEEQNTNQGTLDITFDIEDNGIPRDWTTYIPETPIGYTITEQYTDDNSCIIIYSDSNEREIIYSYSNIENINVSIDNEDSDFKETTINGCKGYSSAKDDTNALYWASGTYFYELQGTCDIDTLYQMAKSLVQ